MLLSAVLQSTVFQTQKYHMTSCSTLKAWRKGSGGETFGVMAFIFQVAAMHDEA